MLSRFLSALVLLCCLKNPLFGANTSFNDAIAKAAAISGRWVGELNPAESVVFSPDSVSSLILNVHTWIRRDGETVEMSFPDVRLQLGTNLGLDRPWYERVNLGHPIPAGANGIEFSGIRRWGMPQGSELRITITPDPEMNALTALIIYSGKSARVVFVRPPTDTSSLAQGDWINTSSMTEVSVFHIYEAEKSSLAATFDRVFFDTADIGCPFTDLGSDIKEGKLALRMDLDHGAPSIFGIFDGSNVLNVEWRGRGSLSEPAYHRLAPGAYPGVLRSVESF